MPAYQNCAINESGFLSFIETSSASLLDEFVTALASNDQANSFFEDDPPVWQKDPSAWVRERLPKADWYTDLTEPEAVAWDYAISSILSHFDCDVTGTEHGAIDFDVFELAEEMFRGDKPAHQMLRMHPYRFHGLAPEIEKAEPSERIYWPTHAMLDTQQLTALETDLTDFQSQLSGFDISFPSIFNSIDERRKIAEAESTELLAYVNRLLKSGAMWFAAIDC